LPRPIACVSTGTISPQKRSASPAAHAKVAMPRSTSPRARVIGFPASFAMVSANSFLRRSMPLAINRKPFAISKRASWRIFFAACSAKAIDSSVWLASADETSARISFAYGDFTSKISAPVRHSPQTSIFFVFIYFFRFSNRE
jgi:hypothetical protein